MRGLLWETLGRTSYLIFEPLKTLWQVYLLQDAHYVILEIGEQEDKTSPFYL